MSRLSRGKGYEKEVKEILQEQGWMVESAINKTVFLGPGRIISVAHDFFHVWDLIAKKADEPTRWIQVTVWEQIAPHIKKIKESGFPWRLEYDEPIIFARIRGGRKPHFRLLYGSDQYEWKGAIEMVIKHAKKI